VGYGCEIGAKSSAEIVFLRPALATGHLELRTEAMAFEVAVDGRGRASGVRWFDTRTPALRGAAREQRAKVVVLACGAVETARLMLLSRSPRFPHGLANDEGQVGRNLTVGLGATGRGEFPPLDDDSAALAIPFAGVSLQDWLRPERAPVPRGGTVQLVIPERSPIGTLERLAHLDGGLVWGRELKRRARRHRDVLHVEFETFCDFWPHPGARVELDARVDRYGVPVARIHADVRPENVAASAFVAGRAAELLRQARAENVRIEKLAGDTLYLQHGTARMGADPRTSVVDVDGRAHGVPNLYVADGAALPATGCVPPTLTIVANALRIGERLLAARSQP